MKNKIYKECEMDIEQRNTEMLDLVKGMLSGYVITAVKANEVFLDSLIPPTEMEIHITASKVKK